MLAKQPVSTISFSALITATALAACAHGAADTQLIAEANPVLSGQNDAPTPRASIETLREELIEELHGVGVSDPYRWLEDERAEEVQRWMTAQDSAARAELARFPGGAALRSRLKELLSVESVGVPIVRGGKAFYLRLHPGKEKAILYVRELKGTKTRGERVLLDPNGWSSDASISLGRWEPSWDGAKLLYAVRPNAADEATLHLIDVATGARSEVDTIEGAKYAAPRWTPDNRAFYYAWLPTDPSIPVAERPGYTEIRFHALGTDPKRDPIVFPRTGNASSFLNADLSRDGRYLFAIVSHGWAENEILFKDLKTKGPFKQLIKGANARYEVLAHKGKFYVLTNEGASNRRLFLVDPKRPERAAWKLLVAEDPGATIADGGFDIVGEQLVFHLRRNAASEVRTVSLDGQRVRDVKLPFIGSISAASGDEESGDLYFDLSSFAVPKQVFVLSKGGEPKLWEAAKVPVESDRYAIEQVWYPSKDGTEISMFLVGAKGAKRSGDAPTLLYGYGGFNLSMTPAFRASIHPWLEAGGIYAVANLRGGGEYGKRWHDAGRLEQKQNTFDDFIAAAEWLVANGYTKPSRLAIQGGSNGGLLVGAAMTQRPDLFGAVICAVPLLDMVRYHLFGSGMTWVPEYGSAEDPAQFKTLYAYSPYHHVVQGQRYPALLMASADHDDRVDPLHARKFVAAVQRASPESVTWLRIERNAGHTGADQVSRTIESTADQLSFLMLQLGVTYPRDGASAQR